jgi:putative transposase
MVQKKGCSLAAIDSFNEGIAEDERVKIRQKKYLNNIVEQDHRFIKKRTKPIWDSRTSIQPKRLFLALKISA